MVYVVSSSFLKFLHLVHISLIFCHCEPKVRLFLLGHLYFLVSIRESKLKGLSSSLTEKFTLYWFLFSIVACVHLNSSFAVTRWWCNAALASRFTLTSSKDFLNLLIHI